MPLSTRLGLLGGCVWKGKHCWSVTVSHRVWAPRCRVSGFVLRSWMFLWCDGRWLWHAAVVGGGHASKTSVEVRKRLQVPSLPS